VAEPRAHRITPTPRPNGADLHVEGFVSALLLELLDLLGQEDGVLLDRLISVVTGEAPKPDPFKPEAELPTERLVADLADRLPTSIRQHRPELATLHTALGRILADQQRAVRPSLLPTLPRQQDRRAS
jgi:hypothetical protein